MSTTPGRHHRPLQNSTEHQPHRRQRVRLLDRVALHLGIALITWGRRGRVLESHERQASRVEQELARVERERAHERSLRLELPLR